MFRFVLLGRIKELIVTAGGENVAPVPIENYLKNSIGDAVSNIVLIGDKRKFLSVLITLKVKQDADGEFTNELAGDAIDVSPNCKTVDQAKNDATWTNLIENGIKKYNRDAKACVSNAQRVQKFVILPKDFAESTGELTSTMKLKRKIIHEKYNLEINSLY